MERPKIMICHENDEKSDFDFNTSLYYVPRTGENILVEGSNKEEDDFVKEHETRNFIVTNVTHVLEADFVLVYVKNRD